MMLPALLASYPTGQHPIHPPQSSLAYEPVRLRCIRHCVQGSSAIHCPLNSRIDLHRGCLTQGYRQPYRPSSALPCLSLSSHCQADLAYGMLVASLRKQKYLGKVFQTSASVSARLFLAHLSPHSRHPRRLRENHLDPGVEDGTPLPRKGRDWRSRAAAGHPGDILGWEGMDSHCLATKSRGSHDARGADPVLSGCPGPNRGDR